MRERKLQVFISSTYEDMRMERQAAVEAVLEAWHIPAGMELFAAGDEEQWQVIKRWIDESDAFLVLVGPRYGTINPGTGRSYVESEYDYAIERSKRHFGVLLSKGALNAKTQELGTAAVDDPIRQGEFRGKVSGKQSTFVDNTDQLKLGIFKALQELVRDQSLIGWVRPDPQAAELSQEMAPLIRENRELREEMARVRQGNTPSDVAVAIQILKETGHGGKSLSEYFLAWREPTTHLESAAERSEAIQTFVRMGLAHKMVNRPLEITDLGQSVYNALKLEQIVKRQ